MWLQVNHIELTNQSKDLKYFLTEMLTMIEYCFAISERVTASR